jgi:hypothetical protein
MPSKWQYIRLVYLVAMTCMQLPSVVFRNEFGQERTTANSQVRWSRPGNFGRVPGQPPSTWTWGWLLSSDLTHTWRSRLFSSLEQSTVHGNGSHVGVLQQRITKTSEPTGGAGIPRRRGAGAGAGRDGAPSWSRSPSPS